VRRSSSLDHTHTHEDSDATTSIFAVSASNAVLPKSTVVTGLDAAIEDSDATTSIFVVSASNAELQKSIVVTGLDAAIEDSDATTSIFDDCDEFYPGAPRAIVNGFLLQRIDKRVDTFICSLDAAVFDKSLRRRLQSVLVIFQEVVDAFDLESLRVVLFWFGPRFAFPVLRTLLNAWCTFSPTLIICGQRPQG